MLVNPSGLDGHAMPIDLNIEHLIGDLKVSTKVSSLTRELTSIGTVCGERDLCKLGSSWEYFGMCQPPTSHEEAG